MANAIYATFLTEGDAERAAGALMDHGLAAADISFVVPKQLEPVYPVSGQQPATTVASPPIVTVPAVDVSVPATETAMPVVAPPPGPEELVHPTIPVSEARPLPADTPIDVVEHDQGHIVDMNRDRPAAATGITTTTAADAARGSLEGAGIGLGLGILLGLATVAIPGVGFIAGTGALVAGLAAATGAAGGVAGGVLGYLADMGVPPDTVQALNTHLQTGGPILSITVSGQMSEVEIMRLLRKYGATSAEAF